MAEKEERWVGRLLRPDARDPAGMESWLTDLAARGLHFREKGDVFVLFVKGAPKAVRYRLDAISKLSPVPDEEGCARAKELGWDYVEELGDFAVYRCEDLTVPELHTDPVVQSYTMDALARKLRRAVVGTVFSSLLLLGLLWFCFFHGAGPVLFLVGHPSSIVLLALVALDLALLPASLRQIFHTLALRRQLRMGLPMEHRADYRRRAVLNRVHLVLLGLILAIQVYGSIRNMSLSGMQFLDKEELPIAFSMDDLGGGAGPHVMTERWSFLAPVQYRVVKVSALTLPDGQEGSALFQMDYYGLSLPILAGPLMDDLRRAENMPWRELAYPGLDGAFLSDDGTLLLLQRGGRVLRVEYTGAADLAGALPKLTAALTDVQPIGRENDG